MTTQRDELQDLIDDTARPSRFIGVGVANPDEIASAIRAAGYTKPRTITDDDGLRAAKAIGTLLRDAEGRVIERVETLPGHLRWYWLSNNITNSVWPYLPATVLYEPTA